MQDFKAVEYRKVQHISQVTLAVCLPRSYVINIGLKKGDFVKLYQDGTRIIIEKAHESGKQDDHSA